MAEYVSNKNLKEPGIGNVIYKLFGYTNSSLITIVIKKRMIGMY